MQASDRWSFYQAKGIKASLVENKIDLYSALGKDPRDEDRKTVARYHEEQKEIEEKAKEAEKAGEEHMKHHLVFARSVTAFQVAIALSAIAVVARKKMVWFLGLVIGAIGTALLVQAALV
jgi:hypothetical protein